MNARRRWEGGGSMNPTRVLTRMDLPVVAAPMAGGPSTAELAAAVSEVGGVGFLAGGYLHPDQVREQIQAVRRRTGRDFGVNLFVGGSRPADPPIIAAYLERLKPMMQAVGVTAGVPRFDDDGFVEKLSIVTAERVPVVSFTFGLPEQDAVRALQEVGSEVWATVTSPEEAQEAVGCGADALVVQGIEAGGHRGVFVDDKDQSDLTLLTALELVRAVTDTPLVAAGGLMTGAALAAALVAGASAGQLGSAYLRCDEAGTSDVHRAAVASSGRTVLTRAFSGRLARGVANRWHEEHGHHAPSAYPEVHHITSPLRGYGRTTGDPNLVNLWAGQAHMLAAEGSARDITLRIAADARAALTTIKVDKGAD